MSKEITPKSKAIELVEKYKPILTTWDFYNDIPINEKLIAEDAKKCALIAVDELIMEHTFSNPMSWNKKRKIFWQSVKQEINNL